MNRITELLDLEDSEIIVSDIHIKGIRKTLILEAPPAIHFCPQCCFLFPNAFTRDQKAQRLTSHPSGRL